MSVDDQGIETLKKAAEEVTPGDKSEYQYRVRLNGTFSSPNGTDAITVTYPTSVTEVYRYRSGGLSGTILKTVTITYTNAAKDALESVEIA